MRQKRAKAYKRLMHAYHSAFGFREPYQVLLDDEFCKSVSKSGVDIEKQLETVLQGKVKTMITQCSITELYKLGPEHQSTVDMAKTFERRKCNHREPIAGIDCLKSVVGDTNKHRYVLATQSQPLRSHVRKIPGIPVVKVNRSVMVMEPMSDETVKKKEEMESTLRAASPSAVTIPVEALPTNIVGDAPVASSSKTPEIVNRKKKPKGPNPLSVKKKKVVPPPNQKNKKKPTVSSGEQQQTKKRKRSDGDDDGASDGGEQGDGEGADPKVEIIGGDGVAEDGGRKEKRKKRKRKSKTAAATGGDGEGGDDAEDDNVSSAGSV